MAGSKITNFRGRYPGIERRSIPQNAATTASNLKLGYGDIRPLYGYLSQETELERSPPVCLFKYQGEWLHLDESANFVTAPSGQDEWDRLIYSLNDYDVDDENAYPAVRVQGTIVSGENEGSNEATLGSPPFPSTTVFALGVPINFTVDPVATSALTSEEYLGDVEDQRTVYYCVTLVNDRGEESRPSFPSNAVVLNEGNGVDVTVTVTITALQTLADASLYYRDIAKARLYRLFAEDQTQTWMFVREINVASTTISFSGADRDTLTTAELDGDTLVSMDWATPPRGLRGIRMLPNGSVVGFRKNELIFSEPWYPYAYPVRYRYKIDHTIIGLGIFGSSVAVLTDVQPYIAVGTHPSEMVLTKLEAAQSCMSRRSIVEYGDRVVWASPDGLYSVGTNGVEALTETFIDKRTWRDSFAPATIHAYGYEGWYIAFYGDGDPATGFMITPFDTDAGLIDLTAYATAGFTDYETDTLYLAMVEGEGYGVFAFDADSENPIEWEWCSRVLEFPSHVNLGRAQILATGYDTGAFEVDTLYLDDTGTQTLYTDAVSVTSRNPVPLRAGTLSTDWFVRVRGTQECEAILIGETVKDLKVQ